MRSATGALLAISVSIGFGPSVATGDDASLSLTLEKAHLAPGEEIVVTTSCPAPGSSAWVGVFEAGARTTIMFAPTPRTVSP